MMIAQEVTQIMMIAQEVTQTKFRKSEYMEILGVWFKIRLCTQPPISEI